MASALAATMLATVATPALAVSQRHRGGPDGGASPVVAAHRLPPAWPKDVPVPPGRIVGTNIGRGHAVVQLLVRGGARTALHSTIAFYHAHGWRGAGPGVHKGSRKIVVVTENRDHSATKTFVVISVSL